MLVEQVIQPRRRSSASRAALTPTWSRHPEGKPPPRPLPNTFDVAVFAGLINDLALYPVQ